MKVNAEGQASLLSVEQIEAIVKVADPVSQLILQVLRYTGERPQAVLKLTQKNCFYDNLIPRDKIIFPSVTRKKAAGKKPKERVVFVVPSLKDVLEKYPVPSSVYMFPSPRDMGKPMSYHCFRHRFEGFLKQAKLQSHNITLYSYRRSFITTMAKQGLTISELMDATGHQSTSSVTRYIEANPQAIEKAMMNL